MLGATYPKGVVDNTDVDTLKTTGAYRIHTGNINLPEDDEGQLVVINSIASKEVVIQYYITAGNAYLYQRICWYGHWRNWVRSDNFGKNTLSDLASALGAFIPVTLSSKGENSIDWDVAKALTYNWITNWYNDMNGDTKSAGVMIHFRNVNMTAMNDLYINLSYVGGIRHSYDLENWIVD